MKTSNRSNRRGKPKGRRKKPARTVKLPGNPVAPDPFPLDPFPLDIFPPSLAEFCKAVAEATSTPPDYAGMTMLATAAAAIGNSRALMLKEGWCETPLLYLALVGDPSAGKTPAMEMVLSAYDEMQQGPLARYTAERAAYERMRRDRDAIIQANRWAPRDARTEVPLLGQEPEPPERYVVTDATVERLTTLLEQNPRGLLLRIDELLGWYRGMGQYKGGRGSDRQFWLSAWSGQSYLVDRVGDRGVPVSIPRLFINIVGGIQPAMLGELHGRICGSDGLVERILFVYPEASGVRRWNERGVGEGERAAWRSALEGLRRLNMKTSGRGSLEPTVVRMDEAVRSLWAAWYDANAAEASTPEVLSHLKAAWVKLEAHAARLALTIHLLRSVAGEKVDQGVLDAESMGRGLRLAEYLKPHLRRANFHMRSARAESRVQRAVEWIRRYGGRTTVRAFQNGRVGGVGNRAEAELLLEDLLSQGFVVKRNTMAGNGRPSVVYALTGS